MSQKCCKWKALAKGCQIHNLTTITCSNQPHILSHPSPSHTIFYSCDWKNSCSSSILCKNKFKHKVSFRTQSLIWILPELTNYLIPVQVSWYPSGLATVSKYQSQWSKIALYLCCSSNMFLKKRFTKHKLVKHKNMCLDDVSDNSRTNPLSCMNPCIYPVDWPAATSSVVAKFQDCDGPPFKCLSNIFCLTSSSIILNPESNISYLGNFRVFIFNMLQPILVYFQRIIFIPGQVLRTVQIQKENY